MHLGQLYFGFPVFDAIPLFAHDTLLVYLLLMKKAEPFALSLYYYLCTYNGTTPCSVSICLCCILQLCGWLFYVILLYDFLALVIITFLLAFLNLFEFRMQT